MAEETNSNTGGSFGGGDIDLSESVFAPLLELGLDAEDIFGNIGAPTGNSTNNQGNSSMEETMDGNNMQSGSENVNIGPFNRLLDIQGADGENLGPQDIFGNLGGGSMEGGGGFGGSEDGEGGPPSDIDFEELPYGGNPFAGDNFWTIFNGGVNPAEAGSGGFGGGGMGGGSNPFAGGEGGMGGGGNPFAGGEGGMGGGGNPFAGGEGGMGGGGNPFAGGEGGMGGGGNPFAGGEGGISFGSGDMSDSEMPFGEGGMGGGSNPFAGGMGGGSNPFSGGMGGGSNPFAGGMGGGSNPFAGV